MKEKVFFKVVYGVLKLKEKFYNIQLSIYSAYLIPFDFEEYEF